MLALCVRANITPFYYCSPKYKTEEPLQVEAYWMSFCVYWLKIFKINKFGQNNIGSVSVRKYYVYILLFI